MKVCRLCLSSSRNMQSIFVMEDSEKYISTVSLLTNVKIYKNDGISDKICYSCRQKLQDAYDFKLLIERSYFTLQGTNDLKRITFSDIKDIKFLNELETKDYKVSIPLELTEKLHKETFTYKNTVIKKIKSEPLTVKEFLNSVQIDSDNDFDIEGYDVSYSYESDSDPSYKVGYVSKNQNNKTKKRKAEIFRKNSHMNIKPIMPVYRNDIELVKNNVKMKKTLKKNGLKYQQEGKKCPGTKKEICPYCGFMAMSLNSHILRMHADEKTYKCDKCSKMFASKKFLENHFKSSHGPRNLKCDQCIAAFRSKGSLKHHIFMRHSSIKTSVCEVCSKSFKTKSHLRRHVDAVHNILMKHKCEQCSMSFNYRHGLRHHMRVHTGERPFKCEICSQPYSYKHDFNRHCLKKHGVFLKMRNVRVMNEEVLIQERAIMHNVMLRVQGVITDDKPLDPFTDPRGALAFELAVKAIHSKKLNVDL